MKILKMALLILSLALIMSACSKKQASSETANETIGSNLLIDSYELQIKYYSELLTSLQDDLSELKADKFMLEYNYKAEIEALKQEIDGLKQHSNSGTSGGNSQNGNDNHDVYPEQLEPTVREDLYKYEVIDQKMTLTEYIGDRTSIKIPQAADGVKISKIGDDAFKSSAVQEVVISNGIEEIGWFAFSGCSSLKTIEIPSSVASVGYGAFEYCSPSLTIICEKGSYIDIYAQSWGIRVEYL